MSSTKIFAILALGATIAFLALIVLQVLEIQFYKPLV